VFTFLHTSLRSAAPITPHVVLLGPTGAGKSVQAAILAEKYQIVDGNVIFSACVSVCILCFFGYPVCVVVCVCVCVYVHVRILEHFYCITVDFNQLIQQILASDSRLASVMRPFNDSNVASKCHRMLLYWGKSCG